jgi:hypothetical protein
VTCIPTARQRVAKHIPTEANALNNRTYIVRQRRDKQALSTVQDVFRGAVQSGYKKIEFRSGVEMRVQLWSENRRPTEAEKSPSLRFVARKRLVKTLQRNSQY